MHACMRVCLCALVRAGIRAGIRVRECACMCVCMRVIVCAWVHARTCACATDPPRSVLLLLKSGINRQSRMPLTCSILPCSGMRGSASRWGSCAHQGQRPDSSATAFGCSGARAPSPGCLSMRIPAALPLPPLTPPRLHRCAAVWAVRVVPLACHHARR